MDFTTIAGTEPHPVDEPCPAGRKTLLAGFGLDQLRGDAITGFAQAAFNPLLSQAIFRDSQCKRVDAVQ